MAKPLTPWILLAVYTALPMGNARHDPLHLREPSPAVQTGAVELPESDWIQRTPGSIEFDFDREDGPLSTYEFVAACSEVTELMFRFDFDVERYLKQNTVRLIGRKSVPRDKLEHFVQVLLLISDVGVHNVGSDELPILELSILDSLRVPFSKEGRRPYTLQSVGDAYEAYFPGDTQQWNLSLLDVLRDIADVSGVQMTWSTDTEKLLTQCRPRLLGERAVAVDQLLPYLQVLVHLAGCSAEVIGNDEVSAILVKPL